MADLIDITNEELKQYIFDLLRKRVQKDWAEYWRKWDEEMVAALRGEVNG